MLEKALRFLREEAAPRAQEMDADPEVLREVLDGMGRQGLLAMKRPEEYGGPALDEASFRVFQEEVARTSGSLAFLQTQHQSAVGMIARSDNEALKQELLPHMHDGGRLVGIGFSQLRRSGPPIMRATPTEGGHILEGEVPWVTGWSFYPDFLIGATLPDGRALFGLVPLTEEPGVVISPPMRLAAMESAQTVAVHFQGFFLPEDRVAFIKPAGWIQRNDEINIALQGHFAIGCAQAGIDVVRQAAERKGVPELQHAAQALQAELDRLREATRHAQTNASEETTQDRLEVRAWAIELAVRCAHAAVAASSGAANSMAHPAQRIYREALVYTVSAQTLPIMEATLRRLLR